MTRSLVKGNEIVTEAALAAGCRFYAGYPITPQNEITSSMAKRMPEVGGTFIQAESEIAAVNLAFGASVAGMRAMTSTSSPGFSLMQETLSFLAGCEIACVVGNERCVITPGNACLFDSHHEHYFENLARKASYCLVIQTPPHL